MKKRFFTEKLGTVLSYVHGGKKRQKGRPVLYLHIGLPKTGTSAIQNFFFQNRKILEKQGILYPDFVLHWSQHVPLAKAIFSPIFPDAHFNQLIETVDMESWYEALQKSCAEKRCSKVVISSEFFWAAPAMQSALKYHTPTEKNFELLDQAVLACKTAFSWFDEIKIIIYLRRQDHWLESFFNQQIKDGFAIPAEKELLPRKNYLLFARNLNLWEKHFGQENVLVRNFSNCNGDVVKDFCSILSVHDNEGFAPITKSVKSANLRLSSKAVKIMRFALENKLEKDSLDLLGDVLRHTSEQLHQKGQEELSGVFSSDFHRQVLSAYEEDNRTLAKQYSVCADFCNNENTEPAALTESSVLSPAEQVEILLERLLPAYIKDTRGEVYEIRNGDKEDPPE